MAPRAAARRRRWLAGARSAAIIFALFVIGYVAPWRPASAETPLALDGPASAAAVAGRMSYRHDPDWRLTAADMAAADPASFRPVEGEVADFGYIKAATWLRLPLVNETAMQMEWVLYCRENFKQLFEVYVAYPDGRIVTAIRQDRTTGFDTRPIAYPELAAPIVLAPGATATVFVRYWSEGASYLPIQIETPTSFASLTAKRTAKNFLYYGMMTLLIVGALVALVIFRRAVFLAYVAYSSGMLVFLMHADGVAFQYIWPGLPGFNSVASVWAGSSLIVFGAIYARIYLRTRTLHPIVDKLLLGVIALTLTIDAASLFLDNQPIKRVLVLLSLIALLLFAAAGVVAARRRFKEVRFYVLAWTGAVLSAGLMTLRHWLGVEVSQDFQYDSMRLVMVFDASMMGLAIVDGYNQMRQSRQAALAAGLTQAQRNLELSARLQELERQVTLADELARSQDHALKDTIHDLRQPLNALRLRIHGLMREAGGEAPGARNDIEAAFGYLERLVNERLAGDRDLPGGLAAALAANDPSLSLRETLESIHKMFLPDAEAKGLRFRIAGTTAEVAAPPLALMRVVSNLVANAIKYTDAGGVVLGARRAGDRVEVHVHDSGPGMSEAAFARASARAVRLEEGAGLAEGHGLGLAIASQIAEREDWTIRLDPRRHSGAGVIVSLPAAGYSAAAAAAAEA